LHLADIQALATSKRRDLELTEHVNTQPSSKIANFIHR